MRDILSILFVIIITYIEFKGLATVNTANVTRLQDTNCQTNGSSVLYNTTLILECPNKPIEWIHRNTTSDGSIKYHMQKNSNTSLIITHIGHENAGCYCCRSVEDFSIKCVTINVLGPPYVVIGKIKNDLFVYCEKPIDIVCPLTGDPKPSITWKRFRNADLTDIAFPDILKDQINNSVIHLDRYYDEISGRYNCIAENEYGTIGQNKEYYTKIISPLDCSGYSQFRSASLTETYYADVGENVTLNCSLRFTCDYTLSCLKLISWWSASFPGNRTTQDYGYRCASCLVWKSKTIQNLENSDFNKVFTCKIEGKYHFPNSIILNTTIQLRPKNIQTEILLPTLLPTASILIILTLSAIVIALIIIGYKKKITMFLYYRLAKEPPYTKELEKDVFISFASKDIDFVRQKIHDPIQRAGYKVIWYPDDFELGALILQEALKSIWKSRKTILCLSQSFLMSEHCKSEKDMCFEKAMKTFKNFLIIIHLDDCEIPKDLKKLKIIEMKQNVNNTEDERKNAYAFSKLKYFLKAPIDSEMM